MSFPLCKPHLPTTVFGPAKQDEGYYARIYREQFAGTPPMPLKPPIDTVDLKLSIVLPEPPVVPKPTEIESLRTENDRLRSEIDRLKNELKLMDADLQRTKTVKGIKPACCVCCRFVVSVVFVDCRHACCCRNCADKLTVCPICRAAIQHATAVVFS